MAKSTMTQREIRESVDVGPGIHQVSPATYWVNQMTESELRGALKLAHEQAMDGMGKGPAHWMGLKPKEFDDWVRNQTIPKRLIRKCLKAPI